MDTVRAAAEASFGGIVRVESFIADCSTVFIFLYIFIVRAALDFLKKFYILV